jgi:hypothetical protein
LDNPWLSAAAGGAIGAGLPIAAQKGLGWLEAKSGKPMSPKGFKEEILSDPYGESPEMSRRGFLDRATGKPMKRLRNDVNIAGDLTDDAGITLAENGMFDDVGRVQSEQTWDPIDEWMDLSSRSDALQDKLGAKLASRLSSDEAQTPGALGRLFSGLKDRLGNTGGEKGAIPTELAARLGLGVAGAAVGGAIDPLDNPALSAMAGFGAGAALPSVIPMLQKLGTAPDVIHSAITALRTPGNTHMVAQKIAKVLPQWQRASYLFDSIGLPANIWVGPYGSGLSGATELMLSGDPRGYAALKELTPTAFAKEYFLALDEAKLAVGRAEGYAMNDATSFPERLLATPGMLLTSGDIAIRRILERVGIPEGMARAMTLTSEPFTKTGEAGAHLRGLGWDLTFPFKRTPINIVEQGALRTPGLGFLMQAIGAARGTRAADPLRQQLVQQGMGLGMGVGAEQIGESLDPNSAKMARRFVTNAAGPASLLAGLGFAIGQAKRKGEPSVLRTAARTLPQQLPMPSIDTIQDWASFIGGSGKIPRGAYPTAIDQAREAIRKRQIPEPLVPVRRP